MSLFGSSRRISERIVRRKLFSSPSRINYGVLKKGEKMIQKDTSTVYNNNEDNSNITQVSSTIKRLSFSKQKICDLIKHDTPINDITVSDPSRVINHKLFDVPNVKRRPIFLKSILNVKWFAKTRKSGKGGPVRQSGGRFGKLDAANEAGFFHKSNRERLMEIKKKLNAKEQGPDAPKKI